MLAPVEAHVRRYFDGHACVSTAWALGPTPHRWPAFRALHFSPGPRTVAHTYVSVGASVVRDGFHREFLLMAPEADQCHIETLAMIAYYHHTQGLDVGHTLPVGRPWCPGARCEHFLISSPYPFGPKLERLDVSGHEVQILWLLPIYDSERKLVHEQGLEALESLLEAHACDYLDLQRSPVV